MRLTAVGVSGSVPGPRSAASCYLVEAPVVAGVATVKSDLITTTMPPLSSRLVLDLGSGAMGPLGVLASPTSLDAALISHLHPDHYLDLAPLYVYLKYQPVFGSNATGIAPHFPIWGPSGLAGKLGICSEKSAEIAEVFTVHTWPGPGANNSQATGSGDSIGTVTLPASTARNTGNPLRFGDPVQIGPFAVESAPAFHVIEAYAMRVTGPSSINPGQPANLVYTGDTDYSPAVVELARNADVLLAEAAFTAAQYAASEPGVHLCGARAGQMAREAGVRQLILTHIPPWNDPAEALTGARAEFGGTIDLAEPGQTFEI